MKSMKNYMDVANMKEKYMKNKVLIFGAMMFFSACTFSVGNKNKEIKKPTSGYYCPMFCEKEKTYTEVGTCPICKMDLEKGGED